MQQQQRPDHTFYYIGHNSPYTAHDQNIPYFSIYINLGTKQFYEMFSLLLITLFAVIAICDSFRQGIAADNNLWVSHWVIKSARQFSMSSAKSMRVIGTRGSPLAQAQAHETKHLLEDKFPDMTVDIKEIITKVRVCAVTKD